VLRNLDWSVVTNALLSVIPALVCITFHEASHGYVAYRLGDTTAKDMGRLTLNPIRHIDLWGLLMMAIFSFGWAKPVPVNMRNFKNPKRGMAITALAGPLSNIFLAAVVLALFGIAYRFLPETSAGVTVLNALYRTAYLSVALAVFNILPIPPLDGSKVLFSFLSDGAYAKLMRYERFGFILLILIVTTSVFGSTVGVWTKWLFDAMLRIASLVQAVLR
jgi:Zn-dependent protease